MCIPFATKFGPAALGVIYRYCINAHYYTIILLIKTCFTFSISKHVISTRNLCHHTRLVL